MNPHLTLKAKINQSLLCFNDTIFLVPKFLFLLLYFHHSSTGNTKREFDGKKTVNVSDIHTVALPFQSSGQVGGEGNHTALSSDRGRVGSSCLHRMDSAAPPSGGIETLCG